MSLGVLGDLLKEAPQYQRLLESLGRRPSRTRAQVVGDAEPFALATLWRDLRAPMLVITPKPEDARRMYEQLALWSGDDERVMHFPETETLPFERQVSDSHTTHERLRALSVLTSIGDSPLVVVASATAIAQKTVDRDTFTSNVHALSPGQQVELDELLERWRRLGYRFEPMTDEPGVVSRRGGILDIFPVGAASPARIELWGDDIESIRLFDPETQRSTEMVDSVAVIPAVETLPGLADRDDLDRSIGRIDVTPCNDATTARLFEELNSLLEGREVEEVDFYAGFFNHGSLLDYFPENGVVVLHRPTEVVEAAWSNDERAHELRATKERRGELPYRFPSSHLLWGEAQGGIERFDRKLDVTQWGAEDLTHDETVVLPFVAAQGQLGRSAVFGEQAQAMASAGDRVVAVTSVPKRLGEILTEQGLDADIRDSLEGPPAAGSITLVHTSGAGLTEGFVLMLDGSKLAVFGDAEIFGVTKQRRPRRRHAAARTTLLSELTPGDYVVHVEHGVGRFQGTGHSDRDQGDREYLILKYAHGDELYVPIDHLDRVTPYVAPMDSAPALTRLGTQEWKRAKARVERGTREMAGELLSLYAARELAEGHASAPDAPWQAELEDSFPFEETPDQNDAIANVKVDMERLRPMDRLICGDVGYGKTEIALRAAFKAVMDGKQVAVLVPTTVLAQQHYVNFSQRLSAYPIKVDVLSRFRTDLEQRAVVEGLASGTVDICIGTHRLIQKDVRFKDLGLVVIDEEQRFGVAHKERLKQMRHEVDVLTLTATPIPRTLHLSLAGIRDMSTIATPPEERLPIKTYVSEFSDELIREAIRRELDRQGQVYFLHNRVYNIDYMASYIRMLVPEAEVATAHGQMHEDQLEQTMLEFADGQMDVLVCTTIIESGLDIPNVNTLIVNRADTFGLAQLYQLRGRVGRGARRAYSYLLIPTARSITEAAEKRLKTMLAATELGAGFQIAMKDLEIRGAGAILGAQQSGHIHAVGFDLYTRLLGDAVEGLRAQEGGSDSADGATPDELAPSQPVSVDLQIPASIPEEYIDDLPTRLSIYRRLAGLATLSEVNTMEDELRDRFGPLPWRVQNLLYVARLKLDAVKAGVDAITRESDKIVLRLQDEVGGAKLALQRELGHGVTVGHMQVRMDISQFPSGWEDALVETVQALAKFRSQVEQQLGVVV